VVVLQEHIIFFEEHCFFRFKKMDNIYYL